MAKIIKKSKKALRQAPFEKSQGKQGKRESKREKTFWLENKIKRIRSFLERRSSRASRLILAFVLFLFVLTNLYSFFLPKDKARLAKERLLKNPKDIEAHLILAEEFLNNNDLEKTKKELLVISSLTSSSKNATVLGSTSWFNDLLSRYKESHPTELLKLIDKWEKVVRETPTYRDGYLHLAFYYFKLGNLQKAKESLNQAIRLDPEYEPSQELKRIIEE